MSEQDIINFGVIRGVDKHGYKIEIYGVHQGETEKHYMVRVNGDDSIRRFKKENCTFELLKFEPQH
jgi:protein subunit release factor B